MPKKLTYPVIGKLHHSSDKLGKGDTVALTEEQAAPLLKLGVIAEASVLVAVAEVGATLKPEGDALTQAIMDAIDELDRDKDFTQGGAPKVASVESQLGYDVSAAEVGAAWDKYQEGNE